MMADAGFTYGPAREYALALLAFLQGGFTLEHVRIAHVLVNLVGFVCLFAAVRRAAAGQGYLILLGTLLLLTHSSLTSFVIYTTTYSFGWADTARAGLATLAVVHRSSRSRTDDPRESRRHLLVGGGAGGVRDALQPWISGCPRCWPPPSRVSPRRCSSRRGSTLRERARAARRTAGLYALGLATVIVPFLAIYALRGRLLAFFEGYIWTVQVSSSRAPGEGSSWFVTPASFASYAALTAKSHPNQSLDPRVLDFVVGPMLPMLGLSHVVTALVRRRFVQRTVLVTGLSLLGTMTLHHAFLAADTWHISNATTPGLVLFVALAAGARRLHIRVAGNRALPVGALCVVVAVTVWLANGAVTTLNARLASIASGEERPSVGKPYSYDGIPRAGDVRVGDEHLAPVRYIQEHSAPNDAVLCATWLLGGGTEAFLSHRRNPTSFDKPDEIASDQLRRRALSELQRDPPLLIVGHYFESMGADEQAFIDKGWRRSRFPGEAWILERRP